MSAIEKVEAGKGRIQVRSDGYEAVLSELSYSYPLKLLSPRPSTPNVAVVYALTYGGGLVAGDSIDLHVSVDDGTSLVLLTQVSSIPSVRSCLLNPLLATCRVPQRYLKREPSNAIRDPLVRTTCLEIRLSI